MKPGPLFLLAALLFIYIEAFPAEIELQTPPKQDAPLCLTVDCIERTN